MIKKQDASQLKGRTDWARIDAFTEEDIERMARDDPDNPATTEADWADATIGFSVFKAAVNAKFDADVVHWFKRQGRGYQARMNAVLRHYIETQQKKAG